MQPQSANDSPARSQKNVYLQRHRPAKFRRGDATFFWQSAPVVITVVQRIDLEVASLGHLRDRLRGCGD